MLTTGTLASIAIAGCSHHIARLGVGSILPKDIADGSFTRRIPSSNDKLLVQLLGAKKAKAHIAAQQEAARPNASARAQRYGKPAVVKKDESDEEEEGRAATFKSKRSEKKMNREIDSDDEDEEMRSKRLAANTNMAEQHATANNIDAGAPPTGSEHSEEAPRAEEPVLNEPELKEPDVDSQTTTPKSAPRKSRAKPKSFLDEILAERSKKKSKKSQA